MKGSNKKLVEAMIYIECILKYKLKYPITFDIYKDQVNLCISARVQYPNFPLMESKLSELEDILKPSGISYKEIPYSSENFNLDDNVLGVTIPLNNIEALAGYLRITFNN